MPLYSNKIKILGVYIDNISINDVISYIGNTIIRNEKSIVSNVNIHALNLCYEIPWFRNFINNSEVVFCDGYGVHLGALLTGQKLHFRFTPPDWIELLCQVAAKNNWPMFFLGAKPNIAHKAAHQLSTKHNGLKIESHHGYFEKWGTENEKILELINTSGAKIVIVGMGMPLQEHWIKENIDKLPNANVFLPVGALFDYVAKTIPRGPKFITDNGFEWLARLIVEPKRLWRRYLIGNPLFFLRLISYHYLHHNKNQIAK